MGMKRLLLDTNAVIALLGGHAQLREWASECDWLGIAVITKLEFIAFPEISDDDIALFAEFEQRVEVVDLCHADVGLMQQIDKQRQGKQIKLPDAIIMASGISRDAKVITADRQLLNHFPECTVPIPEPN